MARVEGWGRLLLVRRTRRAYLTRAPHVSDAKTYGRNKEWKKHLQKYENINKQTKETLAEAQMTKTKNGKTTRLSYYPPRKKGRLRARVR